MKMCSFKALLFVGVLIFFCLPAQSQGLVFSSFEQVQEKRTSLELNGKEPLCLDGSFGLSFDFNFFPDRNVYYGYLVRMINDHHQNIDLIYNHFDQKFSIVFGDVYTHLDFQLDSALLFHRWNSCSLQYDGQMLSLTVNGKNFGSRKIALKDQCFRIFFGACQLHSFKTSDVPPMQVKGIALYHDKEMDGFWPLNELSGVHAVDSIHRRVANVINPVWGTPLHQRWQLLKVLTVKGNGSYTFDPLEEEIYIVGADSIHHFLLRDRSVKAEPLARREYLAAGYQSVYNPANRTLYSIHIDQQQLAAWQPATRSWDIPFDSTDITQYWQTNKFIRKSDNALYILGGYGQLKYKNLVQRFSFPTRKWEKVAVQQTDYKPRYLAALGATAGGDTAYLLGGYGSDNGEQMLNPRYYYDMLRYDVANNRIQKLFTLPEPAEPFVFASSMVIDTTDNSYYALMFPNDRFMSRLQLIKGSLARPEFQLAGDTIPYAFLDNRSAADLYYCARSHQLLAVTQIVDRDKSTEVRIYSLAFPPAQLSLSAASGMAGTSIKWWWFGLAGVIVIAGVVYYYLYRHRNNKPVVTAVPARPVLPEEAPALPGAAAPEEVMPNRAALMLFGEFQVLDKDKNALTHLLSPLLKEMLLLIVIHTAWSGKGISSEKLYEILWHDKPERDARNNRSVNMVKLKAILEKLGSGVILREEGRWKITYDPDLLWVDLAEFSRLVKTAAPGMERIQSLLKIVKEGTFLFRTDYSWLEDIKSDISSKALDILLLEMNGLPANASPEIFIDIANAIFIFDPIHEEALRAKCKNLIRQGRPSIAKSVYEKFYKDYRHMYGENFHPNFQDIIS
ncbi:kelch repeat-containing protein [Chitinophaga ginsengisegetis]|uniref:kelch repeat-containing protein n=1 Tax=Chitinophaga ginsengisegetis TaxID=393003 RepID=UPI000DBA79AF|nr:kelch repeat-containing protein [Chitinophaga ginsengisegetis]MDR6570932.1 DNA-binding SARP family transcriptional activator [Chitinophaga ginsengisegetis]MDR6650666.1 DNA-binding SARP family transcriptional activator [Chitinophaga ginsengisegetis]MDR6657016.1 DNA-binding SARP family transcriptional activator [Chitinophaga ginsengisegetis]